MTTPIKILFLDHTAALSGGEIALYNLLTHLDRARYEPVVALFEEGPLAQRLRAAGIATHIVPLSPKVAGARKDSLGVHSLLGLGRMFSAARFVLGLRRFIRRMKPDVVHTNSLKADILGGVAARLAGVPAVWHVRDRISGDYLPRGTVRVFRFLSRYIPTFVVANSQATLQTLLPHKLARTATVYSGADVKTVMDGAVRHEFSATRDGGNRREAVLVGRISPWKGQHVFIDAAGILHEHAPDARFRIVGAALFSEDVYERQIRQQVSELGLADCVEFAGFRSDVADCIARADLLVHASTTPEPFGQVIVEAMALGKPVVATAGGGVLEIVEDGVTGILVPMGDAPAMAAAIKKLMDDPQAAAAMGQRGRERFLERFTIERVAQEMGEVFDLVAGKAKTLDATTPQAAAGTAEAGQNVGARP